MPLTEIQIQIQAIADAHGITFEQAAKSSASALARGYNDPDVKFVYKDGKFMPMRKIDLASMAKEVCTSDEYKQLEKKFIERMNNEM